MKEMIRFAIRNLYKNTWIVGTENSCKPDRFVELFTIIWYNILKQSAERAGEARSRR